MDAKKENMKIIIFGASGAIGSYLAKKYLIDKHEILLFVKNSKSKKKLIKLLKLRKIDKVIIDNLSFEKKKINYKKNK